MTYEEVLNIIKNERECVKRQNGSFCDNQKDCKNCDLVIPNECVIEVYDITIEAIKKQIQMNPENHSGRYTDNLCPLCGKRIKSGQGSSSRERTNWCNHCGQAIDWSEEE